MEEHIVQFTEDDDFSELDIKHDNVFKYVFIQGTPHSRIALSSLISASIGRRIEVQSISESEPAPEFALERQIRYDINCVAEDGERFNVEMTMFNSAGDIARCEYYLGKLFTAQSIRGVHKSYSDLKRAYHITIFANDKHYSDRAFLHRFEYYDAANNVSLGGLTHIVTVELGKLAEIAK